jgi:hypothetical protein
MGWDRKAPGNSSGAAARNGFRAYAAGLDDGPRYRTVQVDVRVFVSFDSWHRVARWEAEERAQFQVDLLLGGRMPIRDLGARWTIAWPIEAWCLTISRTVRVPIINLGPASYHAG